MMLKLPWEVFCQQQSTTSKVVESICNHVPLN